MERDRNLLFGILSVQIKGVTPRQIVEAGAAWAVDPSVPLSQRLVQAGAISQDDVTFLEKLVDAAINAHQGDASQALASLGGEEQVDKTFHGSIVMRPSGGLDTRPMVFDSALGAPTMVLSTVEELPGRYSHISEYGRGGMGRVLLVHDEHMGRDVALKELLMPRSEWSGPGDSPVQASAGIAARFLQEARLTGRLEHPAIVPVYELGRRSNGTLYYTMKLVRGKTLARALRECKTLQERLGLLKHFVDLCQAIAYAHSRNVIHRDIKPANVMIGEFGETVVLDWGLAKAKGIKDIHEEELQSTLRNLRLKRRGEMEGNPDITPFETRVGEAVGTPNYMSPEQALGRKLDARSDVFALGAVLYELLAGRRAFEGKDTEQTLMQVISDAPRPLRELCPEVPEPLRRIVERALSKDAEQRFPTAAELRKELAAFSASSAPAAAPAPAAPTVWRSTRGRSILVVGAALALLAGVLVNQRSPAPEPVVTAAVPAPAPVAPDPAVVAAPTQTPVPVPLPLPPVTPDVTTSPRPAEGKPGPARAAAPRPRDGGGASGATPATGNGTVALAIAPWGEVLIDGTSRGVAPPLTSLSLPPGTYQIEVRNGAFPPYRARVEVRPGQLVALQHRF